MANSKKLRVNLFEVIRGDRDEPLEVILDYLSGVDIENRLRRVGTSDVRLEYVLPPGADGNATQFWLLDFVKFRDTHGPGKAAKDAAIQGFDLQPEDFFGEETAALYDPATNHLLLQYNHNGVKSSPIEMYINTFFAEYRGLSSYQFRIKLDQTSELRLARKQHVTKIHFKIAPLKVTSAHRQSGVSLDRMLELSDKHASETIEITISAGRGKKLQKVAEIIDGLRTFTRADREQDTHVVSQFNLEAKAAMEERAESINMLLPALVMEVPGVEQGLDRRLTLRSRWDALVRARRGWTEIIEA
jgi:hypothetical protein